MPRRAFTLVELLVVISIIGLLSSIAVVSMNGSRDKARIAAGQSFEQSVYQKLGDKLEGEWRFESLGSTTPDTSGNGRTGTVTNGTSVSGISGNALSLNGTGYVDVGTISVSDSVTVGAWVEYSAQCPRGVIVAKGPANAQWQFYLEANCTLVWRGGSASATVTCAVPSANVWHYVVGTQSDSSVQIYVDGKLCNKASGLTPIANGTATVRIGSFSEGTYLLNGLIDEVRVYSGSLLEP